MASDRYVFGSDTLQDFFTLYVFAGYAFKPSIIADASGEDLRLTVSSVPEPSSLILLLTAGVGALCIRRRGSRG